jgi:acetyl esterase
MPLDPELAAQLEREKRVPARASLSVAETRVRMVASRSLAANTDPLPRERDVRVGALGVREYLPADRDDLPTVVFLHGGRFFSGGIESHEPLCRALAVFSGCRIAAVDYRLAPEDPFPAAVDDTLFAVEWALQQSPSATGVAGDSAGACLAGIAALEWPALSCQVLFYPMLDPECGMPSHREFATGYGPGSEDMRRGWTLYSGGNTKDARLSPLYAPDLHGAPPAYVLTAEYDCLRDEGEEYARRLKRAGAEVRHVRVPGAIHGFLGMTGISRAARMAIVDAGEYLFECLHGRQSEADSDRD